MSPRDNLPRCKSLPLRRVILTAQETRSILVVSAGWTWTVDFRTDWTGGRRYGHNDRRPERRGVVVGRAASPRTHAPVLGTNHWRDTRKFYNSDCRRSRSRAVVSRLYECRRQRGTEFWSVHRYSPQARYRAHLVRHHRRDARARRNNY